MNFALSTPEKALLALRKAATPDALSEAEALRRRGRVRLAIEGGGSEGPRVRGLVDDGRSGQREVSLSVSGGRVEGRCDCGARPDPCAHILAVAARWAQEDLQLSPSPLQGAGWKRVLEALAPSRGRPWAGQASEVLGHWVDLVRRGPGPWGLRICWRSHRTGPRGIGRGRLLTPDRLPDELARPGRGADARVVEAALSAGWSRSPDPVTFPVELSGSRVDALLRALAEVDWVMWEGTREPAHLDPRPLCPVLAAEDRGAELRLSAHLRKPLDDSWDPQAARVVGSDPPWIECLGTLRPVQGAWDGAALDMLLRRPMSVPEADLPVFLGTSVPALESRGVAVELSGVEGRNLGVAQTPVPSMLLSEEASLLAAELRFRYGDYEVTADNPSALIAVSTGAGRAFVRRDMEAEFQATARLRDLGFRPTEPGHFEMRGDEALDFLFRDLDALAADWTVFGRDKLKRRSLDPATLNVQVRVSAGIDWLDLEVEAGAGGETLPIEEVLRAFRAGSRYVRLGDGAHALLPEEWIRRVGAALDDLGLHRGRARLEPHLAGLAQEALEVATEPVVVGRETWERLTAGLQDPSAVPRYPLPRGFRGELRPYQEAGYRWLRFLGERGLGGILADDMGLGKTVQTLALLLSEVEGGRQAPSLVVAPTSVVPNWEAEARRFAPDLRVVRYLGLARKGLLGDLAGAHLVVTSYALLRRDSRELGSISWNYAVLDEAQAIKNAATQTARAARKLRARRRLTLTGTPLENHLGELWSQIHFLLPGLLGSERRFASRFARPAAQGDEGARGALRRRVRPFILRRLKSEVASELPEKVETTLLCEMGVEQERLYRSLLAASRERVLREVATRGLARSHVCVLDALLRLRQACCHPALLPGNLGEGVPSAKFDLFCEFVTEVVEEGHRVLVFSQFVKVLEILRRWFEGAGIRHLYLDGRTRNREERVRSFQEDPSVSAFLVSLKAGGTGLNLTGADYVILFDPWWNPAVEAQATDRAHRIGQTRKVFSYKLVTQGTVEEKILKLQERKRELTEDLIRSQAQWAGALTQEDVEDLFAE